MAEAGSDAQQASARAAGASEAELPGQPLPDQEAFLKAASKQGAGAVRSAKAFLTGAVRTPLTVETAERIDALVCVAPGAEEADDMKP